MEQLWFFGNRVDSTTLRLKEVDANLWAAEERKATDAGRCSARPHVGEDVVSEIDLRQLDRSFLWLRTPVSLVGASAEYRRHHLQMLVDPLEHFFRHDSPFRKAPPILVDAFNDIDNRLEHSRFR